MPPVRLDVEWARHGYNPLTNTGLASIIGRFRLFVGAHLAHCNQVTDVGIKRLAASCPNLNHLDLSCCNQVTDVGIERLAAGCPNLNHLDLGWCAKVTDVGLERLAAGCPKLNVQIFPDDRLRLHVGEGATILWGNDALRRFAD